jgi:hypothetical protein
MKIDKNAYKILGRMAIAMALTGAASAQHLALPSGVETGNLANDIRQGGRGPRGASNPVWGGMIRVDLPQPTELEVSFEVISQLDESGLRGLFPARGDMRHHVRLSGGTPGLIAVLEVEVSGATGGVFARRTLGHGVFGPTGVFEVEIPADVDLGGLAARGRMLGGRVVTESAAVELEPAAEEAFIGWQVLAGLADPQGAAVHGSPFDRQRQASGPKPIR